MTDFTCYLISNKPEYYEPIRQSIIPYNLNFYSGSEIKSFASLVNSCVEQCPTETIIMMSDKVMPTATNVERTLELINLGYGFVGLMLFGFFGFKKELFRKVGPLDENFVSGGYEDHDFYLRLREANIGSYISEEVIYNKRVSSYDYSINKPYYIEKWIPQYNPRVSLFENEHIRQIPEKPSKRDFGPSVPTTFLKWSDIYVKSKRALPL